MGRRKGGNLVRQKGDGEAVQWHIVSGEAGGGGDQLSLTIHI